MKLEYITMFDCDIYAGNYQCLIQKIREDLLKNIRNVVFAINPLKVTLAEENPEIKSILKNADVLIPDGVGILYAAKRNKLEIKERITGIELMHAICNLASETGASIFIYGASQENLEQAVKNLRCKYEKLRIAGYVNGYESDQKYVTELIEQSGADILFVACGSPMQEIYIDRYKAELTNVKFFLGVGGSVDVISGNVKRAPLWIRKTNLEWLYRIVFQKRRLSHIKKIIEFLYDNYKTERKKK